MLVNSGGLGDSNSDLISDVLIPPSIDPVTLSVLAVAGLVIFYYASNASKAPRVSRETKIKSRKVEPKISSSDDSDVIQALVGQGAKKGEARVAVARAKANGASGFEKLFRGALKELR